MERALLGVAESIDKGSSFSDGLRKHPEVFSQLCLSMVERGEHMHRGDIGFWLTRLADCLRVNVLSDAKRIPSREFEESHLVFFTRELAKAIESGVTTPEALTVAIGVVPEGSELYKAVVEIVDDVEKGEAIGEALARHPEFFGSMYTRMVLIGEIHAHPEVLTAVLRRIAGILKDTEELMALSDNEGNTDKGSS